jgi:hypothetical protein
MSTLTAIPMIRKRQLVLLLLVVACSGAIAQVSLPADHKNKIDSLPGVSVTGYANGDSKRRARDIEQKSVPLVNVVAGETIDQSPDISVADVARRVSGLSVTKDHTGQSDRTMIRGIDPKYNYTLVNGVNVPSPDDRTRYISLGLFPADMVQRVEVYKTLTPDMEGGAIGGVIKIVMRDAPDKPVLKFQLATGYNSLYFHRSFTSFGTGVIEKRSPYEKYGPQYSSGLNDFSKDNLHFTTHPAPPDVLFNMSAGKRFASRKAGIMFAADYQRMRRGSDDEYIPQNEEPQLGNKPNLTDFIKRRYDNAMTRIGLHNKWDYEINARNRLSLYQFYIREEDAEARISVDTNLVQGRSVPGTGRINLYQRSRVHLQTLYNSTLQGEHQIANSWRVSWVAAYSAATSLYPDWAELTANTSRLQATDGSIIQTPLLLTPLNRLWLHNSEKDISGSVNIEHSPSLFHKRVSFSTGGLFRSKTRNNFYNAYTFVPAQTTSGGQPFTDIYHAQWLNDAPQNPLGAIGSTNTFNAREQIAAAYFEGKATWQRLTIDGGVRWENTSQHIASAVNPSTEAGRTADIEYSDLLPSAHVEYRLSGKEKLRLSYFKGITRPALYDVSFYSIQYEDAVVAGNPFLKRARADNIDLRYDYFPGLQDQLQAGIFYKQIYDPFEKALLNTSDELYPIPSQGLSYTPAGQLTEQVRNFGTARLYGLEINGTHDFGKWGISGNYTFTHSIIAQIKKYKVREIPDDMSSDLITISKEEKRPLQGQSPNNANLSVWYKNTGRGLNVQMAMIYTGRRIYSVSNWYGLDYWQQAYCELDFSMEKKIGKQWRLFFKIDNLLGAGTHVYLRLPNTDWGTGLLPGQESNSKIIVLRQNGNTSLIAGIKLQLK